MFNYIQSCYKKLPSNVNTVKNVNIYTHGVEIILGSKANRRCQCNERIIICSVACTVSSVHELFCSNDISTNAETLYK